MRRELTLSNIGRRATSGETESEGQAENAVLPRDNETTNLGTAVSSSTSPHLNLDSIGQNTFPDLGDFDAEFQVDLSVFDDDFCRIDTLVENTPLSTIETCVVPSSRFSPGYREQGRKTAEARPMIPRRTSDSTDGNIKLPGAVHVVEAEETRSPAAKPTNKNELLFQCRANGRGWLNALHIAAMRGNATIVRCCK